MRGQFGAVVVRSTMRGWKTHEQVYTQANLALLKNLQLDQRRPRHEAEEERCVESDADDGDDGERTLGQKQNNGDKEATPLDPTSLS